MTCPECGKPFQRSTKNKRQRKYCSHACYLNHLRNSKGEKHPSWKGGPNYYGPNWDAIADSVRKRDKVCQDCGKSAAENGYGLDVHHIVNFKSFNGDYVKANALENLKALCKQCHRKYQEREY